MFAGCRPRTQADFALIRRAGIHTILSFETFTWHIVPERRRAEANGLAFRNIPIFASPLGPTEVSVKQALLALHDSSARPLYIHCLYGRDRTAILIGLYRIYFNDWSPQQAWEEAVRWGLKYDWSLWGFKRYFWRHTQKPDWVRQTEAAKLPAWSPGANRNVPSFRRLSTNMS